MFEIKDALEILERHIEQQPDPARQRFEKPDMRHRSGELDMTHPLAPYARQRHLDRALFADDALVLHALVLAAQALVVLDRPKDARAEQAVALGLEGPVIDGLRLFDLAVGPGQNLLRARDRNPDLVEDLSRHLPAEKIHDLLVHFILRLPTTVGRCGYSLRPSCPGLTRASMVPDRLMDYRVEPGNDDHRVTPPPRRLHHRRH